MNEIKDVTNWRDLGIQLGLSPAKLNEIQESEGDESTLKMITVWMKIDLEASWEKLVKALASPAMCENRAAKSIADRRGSSFDKLSALESQSIGSCFSGLKSAQSHCNFNIIHTVQYKPIVP